jgi:hypothetical protein
MGGVVRGWDSSCVGVQAQAALGRRAMCRSHGPSMACLKQCRRVERWDGGVLGHTGLWLVLGGGGEAGNMGCWGLMLGFVWAESTPYAV